MIRMPPKKRTRRKKAAPESLGLSPIDTRTSMSGKLKSLADEVEGDGGAVIGSYKEPFGGKEVLLAALPIARVEPTPFQRDPSDTHVRRLMNVIEKVGLFLDPVIVIRHEKGFWTPNGNHRLQALRKLGAKTVVGLLVPEQEIAFKILALNTEKSHNLREKSLETIRMARALALQDRRKESDCSFEFEQAPFLTLGLCYEQRPRFSGSAYQPLLRRTDDFLELPVTDALKERGKRAQQLLELDDVVAQIAGRLKERGLTSPYLKAFVVARINPIRFSKATSFDFDDVLRKTLAAAKKFDPGKIKQEDLARAGLAGSEGPAEE